MQCGLTEVGDAGPKGFGMTEMGKMTSVYESEVHSTEDPWHCDNICIMVQTLSHLSSLPIMCHCHDKLIL